MEAEPDLFRAIVESTTDGIWIFDQRGRTTYANARMAELLGRDPAEMAALTPFDVLDRTGQDQMREHLADLEHAATGEDNLECCLLRRDGSRFWALVSHSRLRDQAGQPIGWLHRVTEDTERKLLLDRLQAGEQRLAQAQSIAKVGSWDWDVAADKVTWSDELYRIFNLLPQEFAPTYAGFLAFVHPDDRHLVDEAVGSVFSGAEDFEWEVRVVRRGGDLAWVRGRGAVRRDDEGVPVWMSGTAQDVTEAHDTAQALADSTARYQLLQAMASAANEATSLREALEVAAVELARHTGWQPRAVFEVAEDGALRPLALAGVPDQPPDLSGHGTALARRAQRERRTVWEDGYGIVSHARVSVPVRLDHGVVCVVELLTADGTEPDPDLLRLIDEVASQLSRVADRERAAAELAAARDAAMEASRLKSEFLATMSHEIRTPLHGVIGLNDLLLRTELDEQQRRFAEGVQGAGRTLLGLINDILDLSKIEAGGLHLEEVPFDPRVVFERTAELLSEAARAKNIELVVGCHPDIPDLLVGDPVRLGQVLANLGSNAVNFTEHGEVVVRARLGASPRTGDDSIILVVEVRDTGIGIPEDARDRLFDAFSQADASTTRKYGGTGLGLAISKQLVQAIGGEITVESEVGVGSTFRFQARFRRAAGQLPRAATPARRQSLEGVHTLVVDDNATNRLILTEQLDGWRMPSQEVDSAAAALDAMREAVAAGTPYDLVLLDLCMPEQDGLELAVAIREEPDLVDTRLVLLSSSHELDRATLERAGLDDVLSKPLLHSRLYDSLVQVVGLVPPSAARPETGRGAVPTAVEPGTQPTVLVVEDNPVNQMVARGILENLGHRVEVVDDGLQAVAAVTGSAGREPGRYAAVLMDCQMPHMDGYDATRAIRLAEAEDNRVPILAMTASAVAGERERCLAAGMDDFLTKPIDPDTLSAALARWLPDDPAAGAGAADGTAGADGTGRLAGDFAAGVLDRERLDMLGELGDGALLARFVASFADAAPGAREAIAAAVASEDAPALVQTAHRLKGSAQNLGVPGVGAVCLELELLGDAGDTSGAAELLDRLDDELERALAALRRLSAEAG